MGTSSQNSLSFIERFGKKIPDPVILFISFFIIALLITWLLGGTQFPIPNGSDGQSIVTIKNMFDAEKYSLDI